jgi:hypothetical protein
MGCRVVHMKGWGSQLETSRCLSSVSTLTYTLPTSIARLTHTRAPATHAHAARHTGDVQDVGSVTQDTVPRLQHVSTTTQHLADPAIEAKYRVRRGSCTHGPQYNQHDAHTVNTANMSAATMSCGTMRWHCCRRLKHRAAVTYARQAQGCLPEMSRTARMSCSHTGSNQRHRTPPTD